MSNVDSFYQPSEAMVKTPHGLWQTGMIIKLDSHLTKAMQGDREAESRLCNRIGQLRRYMDYALLSQELQETVKRACDWLRTVGRTVNLASPDPRDWISTRSGKPRW